MPSKCLNRGCGQTFEPDTTDTCVYHSGAPVFHEGLKGWSCCSKRVTDFDEFLKIPGCTTGSHSSQVPESPAPASASRSSGAQPAVAPETITSDNVEIYGTPAPQKSAASAEEAMSSLSIKPSSSETAAPAITEQDLQDPAGAVVTPGTICKRKSCGTAYIDEVQSRVPDTCEYHPGMPVFHEGSKGWTCCSRRVLEFEQFLKIKGCTIGNHRFTDPVLPASESAAAASASAIKEVECRRDWYQTPDKVIISIFAKKVDKSSTFVQFTDTHLKVDIKFLDGSVSKYHTQLFQPVDASLCVYEILSTKIEIVLKKANGLSWVAIEPTDNITTWTTFGLSGTSGTVGGKEAIVAKDAPLHLISKN
eukprot:jgi/Hompol1/4206/HPOL_003538-RA